MKRSIELHKKTVEYTLKVSRRAHRMRLAVYCDGSFVVTVPHALNQNLIEKFIVRKSQWVIDKLEYFKDLSGKIFLKGNKRDFLKHQEAAYVLAHERVAYFNKKYKFPFNQINIKNQKTRWGSCSLKRNLNFNYKIVLLPKELSDYIIVHELCHLKEFNHSKKFWNLVVKIVPNYLDIREDLKHSGIKYR